MNNKSKKATPKKQTGKAADKPAPVTPDLDKAEALIDKMIADGTFQKMADQQAKIHQERINAIKERNEQERQANEQKIDEKKAFAHTAQEKTLQFMKEYVQVANQSTRTGSCLHHAVLQFFDYNLDDNLDCKYFEIAAQALATFGNPETIEKLGEISKSWWYDEILEMLAKVISMCSWIKGNPAAIAELEVVDYDSSDHTGDGIEHILCKMAKYEHGLQALKTEQDVWKAYDEAHKD